MGYKERLIELKEDLEIIYEKGDIFERAMVRGVIEEIYDDLNMEGRDKVRRMTP